MAAPRFRTLLLGLSGLAALLLGGLGIYGVMSHSVSQRTREFGIRIALGADLAQILKSVIAHGLRLTFIGVLNDTSVTEEPDTSRPRVIASSRLAGFRVASVGASGKSRSGWV